VVVVAAVVVVGVAGGSYGRCRALGV